MIVVSDTSPLNYLVMIRAVHVLPTLFNRVLAPPAVIGELRHTAAPPCDREWVAALPGWIEVIAPSAINPALRLGTGESEAISLALEMHEDALLLDERKALSVARKLGLSVTGTVGVLDLAASRDLIDLPDAIEQLRQTNFRCPAEVFDALLLRHRDRG